MQAAERIFDGAFEHVVDEPEEAKPTANKKDVARKPRMIVSVVPLLTPLSMLRWFTDTGGRRR